MDIRGRKKSVVTDPGEASGKYVLHKALEEGLARDGGDVAVTRRKRDVGVGDLTDTRVGDADAMCVATEISEQRIAITKRGLCIDDPGGRVQSLANARKVVRVAAGRCEWVSTLESIEACEELPAEKCREHCDGKQVRAFDSDPARAVERESACAHDTMQVRVIEQLACPCVEHSGDGRSAAESGGIGREGQQRFGGSLEEQRVDASGFEPRDCAERVGQREDDVEPAGGRIAFASCKQPPILIGTLTSGTVTIATAIVDGCLKATLITDVQMPAEHRSATRRDVIEHLASAE